MMGKPVRLPSASISASPPARGGTRLSRYRSSSSDRSGSATQHLPRDIALRRSRIPMVSPVPRDNGYDESRGDSAAAGQDRRARRRRRVFVQKDRRGGLRPIGLDRNQHRPSDHPPAVGSLALIVAVAGEERQPGPLFVAEDLAGGRGNEIDFADLVDMSQPPAMDDHPIAEA